MLVGNQSFLSGVDYFCEGAQCPWKQTGSFRSCLPCKNGRKPSKRRYLFSLKSIPVHCASMPSYLLTEKQMGKYISIDNQYVLNDNSIYRCKYWYSLYSNTVILMYRHCSKLISYCRFLKLVKDGRFYSCTIALKQCEMPLTDEIWW